MMFYISNTKLIVAYLNLYFNKIRKQNQKEKIKIPWFSGYPSVLTGKQNLTIISNICPFHNFRLRDPGRFSVVHQKAHRDIVGNSKGSPVSLSHGSTEAVLRIFHIRFCRSDICLCRNIWNQRMDCKLR